MKGINSTRRGLNWRRWLTKPRFFTKRLTRPTKSKPGGPDNDDYELHERPFTPRHNSRSRLPSKTVTSQRQRPYTGRQDYKLDPLGTTNHIGDMMSQSGGKARNYKRSEPTSTSASSSTSGQVANTSSYRKVSHNLDSRNGKQQPFSGHTSRKNKKKDVGAIRWQRSILVTQPGLAPKNTSATKQSLNILEPSETKQNQSYNIGNQDNTIKTKANKQPNGEHNKRCEPSTTSEPAIITYLKKQYPKDTFKPDHGSMYTIEHQVDSDKGKTETYELDTNDSGGNPISKTIKEQEPDYFNIAKGALELAIACRQYQKHSHGKIELDIRYNQDQEPMPIELAKAFNQLARDNNHKDLIIINTDDSRLKTLLDGKELEEDETKKAEPEGSATSSPSHT